MGVGQINERIPGQKGDRQTDRQGKITRCAQIVEKIGFVFSKKDPRK